MAAVILAGGKGERLGGVNKALIPFGPSRLIDRALVATAGCDPMIIASGRSGLEVEGARSVPDLDADYAGPLAGVAAAVAALSGGPAGFLLSMAVDTPFFPHDFIERALAAIGASGAAVAAFAGQSYPTNALWRLERIASLPAQVRAGTAPHSLKRLMASVDAVTLDYAGWSKDDPFANGNTAAELKALRRRLTSTG